MYGAFDKQPQKFRKDIIEEENSLVVQKTGSILSWQKYIGNNGMSFGIDRFGESAPYKDVYDHLDYQRKR